MVAAVTPVSMPNYDNQRLCAVRDNVGDASCLWPFKDVTIFAEGRLGEADMPTAVEMAIGATPESMGWNKVCGLRMRMHTNKRTAHIYIDKGHIDGPMGTLAWSYLPCGFTPQQWNAIQQMYDTGDMYVIADNPPNNKVDLVRVACHEIGHAIGISHITDGNLLAPMYSARIRWPQRGDIAECRVRYGLPDAQTPTTFPPTFTTQPPTGGTPFPPPGGDIDFADALPCLRFVMAIWRKLSPQQQSEFIHHLTQEGGHEFIQHVMKGGAL